MSGPECDWCGASGDDGQLDVTLVGDDFDFVCDDCREQLNDAAPDLLDAVRAAVQALNVARRYKVGDTDSYAIAAKCDAAIRKAKGKEVNNEV